MHITEIKFWKTPLFDPDQDQYNHNHDQYNHDQDQYNNAHDHHDNNHQDYQQQHYQHQGTNTFSLRSFSSRFCMYLIVFSIPGASISVTTLGFRNSAHIPNGLRRAAIDWKEMKKSSNQRLLNLFNLHSSYNHTCTYIYRFIKYLLGRPVLHFPIIFLLH